MNNYGQYDYAYNPYAYNSYAYNPMLYQQQPQQQQQQQMPPQQQQQMPPQQPQQQMPQQPQQQMPQQQQQMQQQPQQQMPQVLQQQFQYQTQYQQQYQEPEITAEEPPVKSFDYWHPCGDGKSIFLPNPALTVIARMVIRNCLWIVLGLTITIIAVIYFLKPHYDSCRSFVIVDGLIAKIPLIGKPISAFMCLWYAWYAFLVNTFLSIF